MSGGIAYVLDENGDFRRENAATGPAWTWNRSTTPTICTLLRSLIDEHVEVTDSPRAQVDSGKLGRDAAEIRQGIPARVQARAWAYRERRDEVAPPGAMAGFSPLRQFGR